ncbi:MAG: hypothetical protein AB1744_12270, partial [Candidatus Zixiibacteriota bacterium]
AAQADAGTNWNYALSFVNSFGITVSTALDVSTLSAGLQPLVTYNSGTSEVSYNGVMTTAHRDELKGKFSSAADKQAIDRLYHKTLLTSSDGRIDIAPTVPTDRMKAHFLNMEQGGDEAAALKFLEMWINDKLSADYRLETITAAAPATGGTPGPSGTTGGTSSSPAPATAGSPAGP